jgi:DNA-binding SARP family transcriptional activator/Tfp pilus assembly protein PilF
MGTVNTPQNQQLRPAAGLEIRLLGPLTVQLNGKPVALPARKTRALLAYLARREGVDIARTTLVGLLWGERDEAQARASLRQSLSELRGALGEAAEAIKANKETVSFAAGAAWLDTKVLEAAASGDNGAALGEAAALSGGDFLEGLLIDEPAFDQWQTGERESFRRMALTLHDRLMKQSEHDGNIEAAVTHGLKMLGLDPLQEQMHRALMRLYLRQGRPDAALAQYERCERELSSQLGVRPEAETEALMRSIRASRREGPPKPATKPPAAMAEKPSITVLPFANLSAEREHGFFAQGLTQDIIGALSRIKELLVVSSNAKQMSAGIVDLAQELGVDFVLDGSVRAAGSRIRVTAHLVDGRSGKHVWAERYEGELADIFAVQDQITQAIALAMQVKLTAGDMAQTWEGQTRNLRAWEKAVTARDAFLRFSKSDNENARQLLEEAISIDPGYTGAMVLHGMTHWWDARFNRSIERDHSLRLAEDDCQRVLALDPHLGIAQMLRGGIAWLRGDNDQAMKFAEKAVSLVPSDAHSVAFLAMLCMYAGEHKKSIATLKHAMRLCPQYPPWYTYYMAYNNLWTDNLPAALELGRLYHRQEPDEPFAFILLATIFAFQGKKKEAAEMIGELRLRFPGFGMGEMRISQHYREREKFEKVTQVLRAAGLPD